MLQSLMPASIFCSTKITSLNKGGAGAHPDMKIIRDKISLAELKKAAEELFGDLVKVVVDVEKKIMVIGAELHSDEEALLIEHGSAQQHLWGINLYPEIEGDDWIEFDSLINIRPSQGNRSRGVEKLATREIIIEIVNNLIER
jgi:Protein of unknown function (DUF5674)